MSVTSEQRLNVGSTGQFSIRSASLQAGTIPLIDDINLELSQGDRLLLVGPNGSGKSTLLSVILGLRKLNSGQFTSTFRRIGYVPQWRSVEFQYLLSVEEMLLLSLRSWPVFSKKKRLDQLNQINEMLRMVDMTHRKDRLLRECSGGELQRAFLARAFLLRPDLLILDEPISAVDTDGRAQILSILKEFDETYNPAMIATLHDPLASWQSFFTMKATIINRKLQVEDLVTTALLS